MAGAAPAAPCGPIEIDDRSYALVAVGEVVSPDAAGRRAPAAALREMAVLEERQRIALQLHDRVIPRLFAAGLAVSAVSDRISDSFARARVKEVVDDLDAAISDVRSVIFELSPAGRPPSLRDRVIELCTTECDRRQVTSSVQFRGAVDTLAAPQAEALLSVLRETLASVARHGGTSAVDIAIEVDADVVLRVEGHGPDAPDEPPDPDRDDLEELAVRAEGLGGVFRVHADCGASRVDWRAPRD